MKNIIIALSSLILLTSCIAFKGNNLPTVKDSDIKLVKANKVKIFNKWTLGSSLNPDLGSHVVAFAKQRFIKTINDSKCCVVVAKEKDADVVVDGKVHDENNMTLAMISGTISGLTFTVIPAFGKERVHISVDVRSKKDSKYYDLKDHSTFVIWLPMILAMPFSEKVGAVAVKVNENAYKTLVLKMKEDGFLN